MIKPKLKICGLCHQKVVLWTSSPPRCLSCHQRAKTMLKQANSNGIAKPFLAKRQKPIKKVSDKQAKLNALYKILRDEFMDNHPICQARLQGCTVQSTECHHQRGRGKYFLDQSTYIALCHSCHVFINEHNDYAKRFGFVKSRLSKR